MIETRVLRIKNKAEAAREIKKIGAYSKSIPIMSPKAVLHAIKIKKISAVACNILKQEMLSVGGDAAVSKDVITKSPKSSDCLLFGTISQIEKLCLKIKKQPFKIDEIGKEIKRTLDNYHKRDFKFAAGKYKLRPGRRTYIMGILNVTPDSFFDGGRFFKEDAALSHALKMAHAGADIIDVGGESTRPGAISIKYKEQIRRVIPVIKKLSKKIKIPISIDTRSYKVAKAAIDAGASIINDISGLRADEKMAKLASESRAGLILMHMKGSPKNMQKKTWYKCLMQDIINGLDISIDKALDAGVKKEQIVIDPGIGFSKTTRQNLMILSHLSEFKVLGFPIMVGISRKSLIGDVLNLAVDQRLTGTLAGIVYSMLEGANILRVHDVKETKEVIKMTETIRDISYD